MKENFKPVAVQSPDKNPVHFALRCIGDLQLLTIHRFLRPRLSSWNGRVLDVGAGASPWKSLMGREVDYRGIDTVAAGEFGMDNNPGITYYSGNRFPCTDDSFDAALCTEVLEHVPDADALMGEIARVLRPGGTLVITVPWSARLHHIPHDYARYSRFGLASLLERHGFDIVSLLPRGNDFAAIANKMLVAWLRLLRPGKPILLFATLPAAIMAAPFIAASLLIAHASMFLRLGSEEDPLGYGIEAIKRRQHP